MHVTQIRITRFAQKQLEKIPESIQESLRKWIKKTLKVGIREIRKQPSYHGEPLKGHRQGQRSIRLNRSYRAIYEESNEGIINIIVIIEVNKHDY